MLDLAREEFDSSKRVEGITREQVRLGGTGSIEADRIRVSVLDGEREVHSRQSDLITAKAKLLAALGRKYVAPTFAVQGSLDVPRPATSPQPEEAIARPQQDRPDIASLRTQIDKALPTSASKRPRRTRRSPLRWGIPPMRIGPGLARCAVNPASVVVSVPLFDRSQGNINKARSAAGQAAFNLQAQLSKLHAEIEQAVAEFVPAEADVALPSPEQLGSARSVRDPSRGGIARPAGALLEVIDAEKPTATPAEIR